MNGKPLHRTGPNAVENDASVLRHPEQEDMPLLGLTVWELLPFEPEHISRLVEHDLPVRHFREVQSYGLAAGLPDNFVDDFLRESVEDDGARISIEPPVVGVALRILPASAPQFRLHSQPPSRGADVPALLPAYRSEEHTSELQSLRHL